jgi:hypothetical protein
MMMNTMVFDLSNCVGFVTSNATKEKKLVELLAYLP